MCYILSVQSHCVHIVIKGLGNLGNNTVYMYEKSDYDSSTYVNNNQKKILTHDKHSCLWRVKISGEPYFYENKDCSVGIDTGFSNDWIYTHEDTHGDIYTFMNDMNASISCIDQELMRNELKSWAMLTSMFFLVCFTTTISYCFYRHDLEETHGSSGFGSESDQDSIVSDSCMPTPLPTPRSSPINSDASEVV